MKYAIIRVNKHESVNVEFDIKNIAEKFCIVCNKGLTKKDDNYLIVERRNHEREKRTV